MQIIKLIGNLLEVKMGRSLPGYGKIKNKTKTTSGKIGKTLKIPSFTTYNVIKRSKNLEKCIEVQRSIINTPQAALH